jgi:hypothetical protein
MRRGSHFTDEQKAKMMGHPFNGLRHHTAETRAKISVSLMGHLMSPGTRAKESTSKMGHVMSIETRAKLSAVEKEAQNRPEVKARMSVVKMGHTTSAETRGKIGVANWKGGRKISSHKDSAKRRTLGFHPLNAWFPGCEGHHVDSELVIHMPKKLHRSVWHRQRDGRGMAAINAVAYNYLFKQKAEVSLAHISGGIYV